MKGAMTRTSEKTGKASGLHNTLVYMRQHWQLYLIFMLPPCSVDRHFPLHTHGRRFDRVYRVQPHQRYPGKRVGWIQPLYPVPVVPGLYAVSDEHPEAEYLRLAVGGSRLRFCWPSC